MTTQELRNEIIARLSAKKPHKVILFGSLARGNFGPESDVDLIVVLDKEGIPRTFKEKTENSLEVSRLLRDLNKRMAMDLVVMTRTQWERFVETDSGFSREVQARGLPLEEMVKADEDTLAKLNQIYIDSRYPASLGSLPEGPPGVEDAKEFYNFAREVLARVKAVLQAV